MTENNKAILKKANDAVTTGNYEEFLNYCTDDTKWTFIGDQVLNGKEEVRNWMLNEYIEPPKNVVKNLIAENEYLTALGVITVLNKNGKTDTFSYCDVWKIRDGKLAELVAFVVESDELKDNNF
ncbi:nuclear transport factor 2 family protein [Salmonirosea aquatica]|uniref:Nuclear transport factor 2 family protein n=1 Tax=Salmonirosea aquatica TaxID=2654236 RepID=A0A7C9BKG3_9BACT|nr:nuclear transport factor 2 family protein [Cytophagaceae bacterium SJW1-29]